MSEHKEPGFTPYENSEEIIHKFMAMPQKPVFQIEDATLNGIPLDAVDGDTFEVVAITHPAMKPIIHVKKVGGDKS